ncbi:TPA: hypothetical protein HA265_05120 [Candidatus Woesearchaeota archaeon]|nr:hypothetical protein [Candidatus Woesearchaeota archaeon]
MQQEKSAQENIQYQTRVQEGQITVHELRRIRRNNQKKAVIGFLLLLVVGYFIWTNFDIRLPWTGMVVTGEKTTCVETRGPKMLTDTVIKKLKVSDEGFEVSRSEDTAALKVRNADERDGTARVTLYCEDGDQQGENVKNIKAGETETFMFQDVAECDLSYVIEPQIIREQVNRTVYVSGQECD